MRDAANSELDATEVARGYIRCSAELSRHNQDPGAAWNSETDPDQRDFEIVERAIRGGPALRAWQLVVAILAQETDDRLAFQAAGPLEDLVRLRGTEVVELVEAEATSNERFKWALGKIWVFAKDLPADVVRRVVAASGNAIRPS